MTIIEKAIVNGIAGIASMVNDGILERVVLENSIDQMCNAHGTEYVASLLIAQPDEYRNNLDKALGEVA